MSHTNLNARYARAICAKSIKQPQQSLKLLDSIQQIQNNAAPSDLRLYSGFLTIGVHSRARALQGLRASLKGVACLVAIVIGIAMSMPMAVAPAAQIVPIKSVKQYAKEKTTNSKQWSCLSKLWGKESAWNHLADNPHSTAFGIPQILGLTTHDPYKQIDLGIKYIKHRYNTPCKAWVFHKRKGYY